MEPDPSEDEIRAEIEKVLGDPFFASESEDMRNSIRLILAAIYLGPNADKLARFLGLNRDQFVRPRAKRLRENGIFVDGPPGQPGRVGVDADVLEEGEGVLSVWLILAALCAEDLVCRSERRHEVHSEPASDVEGV